MLMSELRWGVKPPFKGLKPKPTVKSEPSRDADEILFENLGHLHETGAITIHDEEVLNESLLALARTGVITVNTAKSIQTGKKIQTTVRRLADDANKLRGTKGTGRHPETYQRCAEDDCGDIQTARGDDAKERIHLCVWRSVH